MASARFEKIDAIYREAVRLAPEARAEFLRTACGDDLELLRAVEVLLKETSQPAATFRGASQADSTVTLINVGSQLGPYRIEATIGAGGMGQVFRGVDTRLGRPVAIKISHELFNERFEREARAISALNHPHICTLYDIGQSPSGVAYMVMELVEGETLAAQLRRGKLSLPETLRYGSQIADALAAAHAKGIVHRDLKPGNVMITATGVKVLDFGLAKSNVDARVTASNVAMGTPAYMAPEQFEGKEADGRTDMYALGLILYEMAAGKRPVPGRVLPETFPPQFGHVIDRCLALDRASRWQTANEVRAVLELVSTQTPASVPASTPRMNRQRRWLLAGSVILLFGAVGAGYWWMNRGARDAKPRVAEFQLSLGDEIMPDTVPVPSPGGDFVVFQHGSGQRNVSLWLRPLNSTQARPLAGTEGAGTPFWSPDGKWIAFFADGKLKKISPEGGSPQTIAAMRQFQEGAWGSNGDIVFRPDNRMPLFRIRDTGGEVSPLTHLDAARSENSHRGITVLPDGQKFLFTARCSERTNNALYIGSLATGAVRRVMPIDSVATYAPPADDRPGMLIYYRDGAMVAQPFDPAKEAVTGAAAPFLESVGYTIASIVPKFRTSQEGSLAIFQTKGASDTQLVWHDRLGQRLGTVGPRGVYLQVRISPDGNYVATSEPDPNSGNRDIVLIETARGVKTRLVSHAANDWFPVWSPDGSQLAFESDREGGPMVQTFIKRSLDPAAAEVRVTGTNVADWSRDGRWLLFGSYTISVTPPQPAAKPISYLDAPGIEYPGRFSPDSKWIAYTSRESGVTEVYAIPFTGGLSSGGRIQISNGGGDYPVWSDNGRELFFMDAGANVYSAAFGDSNRAGQAPRVTKLFHACEGTNVYDVPLKGNSYSWSFDTRDGKRFLVDCTAEAPGQFTVLLNSRFGQKP